MDLNGALQVFGLDAEATPADLADTYRGLRKPLLKELNKFDEGEEPAELVEQLESLETAYKVITACVSQKTDVEASQSGSSTQGGRSSGRVAFAKGDVVLDRYEIEARIVDRPEGETYRVRDRVRDVPVALKVIAPSLVREPRQRARIHRSLQSASYLNHRNLARVLGVLKLPHTYAVIQQLPADSENLWDLMYGEGAKKDRLSQPVVLGLTEQAAHALEYLHTLTPHAALRPESVWLAPDGTVKIADFGFADVQRQLRDRRLSRSKLGTAYWAPEQYHDDVAVGAQSDQYALALILYEILSGKPLVGRTQKVRGFRRDYPQRFTQAVERALSSKPSRRFESMDAFGDAACSGYRADRAAPAAVSRESMFVPALVLLALFAGFVLSPFGRGAAGAIGAAVGRWQAVVAGEARVDLELRRLQAMSGRLHERREALDATSRTELDRVRTLLADPKARKHQRGAIQSDLTSIVRQLVATSRRRAEAALAKTSGALDALEDLGRRRVAARVDAAQTGLQALDTVAPKDRLAAVTAVVRQQAAAVRGEALWRRERAGVLAAPAFAAAYRGLLEAEAALAIGDDAASEGAYERAAAALEGVLPAVQAAGQAVRAFDPLSRPAGIPIKLDAADAKGCFDALVAEEVTAPEEADLTRTLAALRAEGARTVDARAVVQEDGYWTLDVRIGARALLFAGTWTGAGAARRLQVLVVGDRALPGALEVAATRGEGRPGASDLRAMLAQAPQGARSLWCVRDPDARPLPTPAFEQSEAIVRAGEQAFAGTLAQGTDCAVLVAGKRFELDKERFEARVRVAGDVLVTWLRAHAVRGMNTGPGAVMRVQTDGVAPRVHVIEPAQGAKVDPGSSVTVRAIVYDSNLTTLEVAGEAQTLRRDEVYKLIETTLQAPARGRVTLPIRAVDAAGTEMKREFSWEVR